MEVPRFWRLKNNVTLCRAKSARIAMSKYSHPPVTSVRLAVVKQRPPLHFQRFGRSLFFYRYQKRARWF